MKILMLNHEFPPVGGGASPVTWELCKQLASMGHKVDVVTMHYGDLPRVETVEGVNIYRTPAIRKRPNICYTHELATYLPGAFFKTLSLARKNKYDIIHCHFLVPGAPLAYLVSKLSGIPFIVTCHGTDVPGHNPDRFDIVHKMISPAWRFLAKRANLITSPSEFLKQKIVATCPDVKVEIIPNGIYFDSFQPGIKSKSILMCSRIFKFKGFQYALEAIGQIKPDWQVNVIGQGPYIPQLEKLAQQLKINVKFWGWMDKSNPKFYDLYNTSSIFIFPSEAENFPTALLEAMSAKMAIITSNAGGCPEIVGDAGLLVEPRNPGQIKTQLLKLLDSEELRNKLGSDAQARAQQFSWPRVAQNYLDCYQRVIG
jgi:glycosyltransferase involved in cell wall biosynthesis